MLDVYSKSAGGESRAIEAKPVRGNFQWEGGGFIAKIKSDSSWHSFWYIDS